MQGIAQRTTTGVIQGDSRDLGYSSHSDIATLASVNSGLGFGQGPRELFQDSCCSFRALPGDLGLRRCTTCSS